MHKKNTHLSLTQALQLFHQDGAIDVIAGATLLNFGFDVLGQAESTSLFTWIPILLLTSLKNKNTLPKIKGYLENVTEKHLRRWTLVPSIIMVLSLVLLGIIMLGDPLDFANVSFLPASFDLSALLGFMVISIACLIPALWIKARQFYMYSAVAFAAGLVSFFFLAPAWSVFLTAVVMLFFGGRRMVHFSREYPLSEEKPADEN